VIKIVSSIEYQVSSKYLLSCYLCLDTYVLLLFDDDVIDLIEDRYDGDSCQDSLDKPGFHDNGGFIDSLMFEEMMKRGDCKEFSFEIFFPENLQKT
jgi:hypothetical protein